MFFNQYPYNNLTDLNLDFLLKAIGEMRYEVENFVSINAIKYANPIQWDITRQYEKNTIVIDPQSGTAYISVAPVPVGVSLTNTDFWTVVFDLERFVTKANGNFSVRIEEMTTLTASFPTNKDEWLVWGGVLYRANTNIIAGDQYVVDSNITRITIEEVVGYVERLKTTVKDNLVNAINELFDGEVDINNIIGVLSDLDTVDKSNIVNAINEVLSTTSAQINALNNYIGNLQNLNTTDKSNVVNAINEVLSTTSAQINALNNYIGNLQNLNTTDKSNVVNAINEVLTTITNDISTTVGDLASLITSDKSNIVNAINETKRELNALSIMFNNIVIPKNRQVIVIGDSYGMRNTPNYLTLLLERFPDNIRGIALSSYGFVPFTSNNKNFYSILYDHYTTQMTSAERTTITDVVYLGGWNDAHRIAMGEADGNLILNKIHEAVRDTTIDFPNCKVWIGFVGWQTNQALIDTPSGEVYPSFNNLRDAELVYTNVVYPNCYQLDGVRYPMRNPNNYDESYFHPNANGGYAIAFALCGELFGGSWNYNVSFTNNMGALDDIGIITTLNTTTTITNSIDTLLIEIFANGTITSPPYIGKFKSNMTPIVLQDKATYLVGTFKGTADGVSYSGGVLVILYGDGRIGVYYPDLTMPSQLIGRIYIQTSINNKYNV